MTEEAPGGLFSSLKTLASTLLGMVHTRVELLSAEIEEEIERLTALFLAAAIAILFMGLGIVFGAILLVVAWWDTHRLLVLGLLSAFFIAVGIFFGSAFRSGVQKRPRIFASTLSELKKDRGELQ